MPKPAFYKITFCFFVLFFVSMTCSCREKEKEANLEISLRESVISNVGGSTFLRVETDDDNVWSVTIEQTDNWVTVNPTTGTGSRSAVVVVSRNPSGTERSATIAVAVGKTKKSVGLLQEPYVPDTSNIPEVREVPFRLELPLVRDTTWYIQHNVEHNGSTIVNFALEYDTAQRHAIWVAYILNAALLNGSIDRNNFTFDPKIPIAFQPHEINNHGDTVIPRYWTMSDNTYERGHLLASADRPFSQAANDQTNYLSNISPHLREFHNNQGGTGSGSGVWLRLEGLVRTWALNCDTLYVVKGGSIIPGAPGTEIVEILTGINNTVVPRYYFKALVARRGNDFEGIAFWLEQEKGMARRPVARTDVITIRELEQKTGINFFHNLKYALPDNPNLEEQVETRTPNWSWWSSL